ncbi:electron transport complex subunit RsxB [Buchnera aphidicola (Pemphigus obesinymphae)]|uniref:electron transport complex subunit RsxB n=1 Tax=Buchnera aphidicola TaxID=9 RepID=UPI002236FEB7|nr:electron transport complex subunit RsxB [Buchnera aphidicola (Pemphigus obesinymphae)]
MIIQIIRTIFIFSFFSIILGFFLHYFSYKYKIKKNSILDKIEDILPQSQCGQCGYPGCLPYAKAIFKNKEKINKCLPGGKDVFLQLQNLLSIDTTEYNINSLPVRIIPTVVFIDEQNCVGCAKCREICPVDAIIGSLNLMHTVLTDFCTGCNLCIPVCPLDCIHTKSIVHENKKLFNKF